MITEDPSDRLSHIRASIRHHMEDAAALYQQLPETEDSVYLVYAVVAWELLSGETLPEDKLKLMIEQLMLSQFEVSFANE